MISISTRKRSDAPDGHERSVERRGVAKDQQSSFLKGGCDAEEVYRDATNRGNPAGAPRGGPQPERDRQQLGDGAEQPHKVLAHTRAAGRGRLLAAGLDEPALHELLYGQVTPCWHSHYSD